MSKITATYRVTAPPSEIDRIARFIAVEQTVEVPELLIQDDPAVSDLVGELVGVTQTAPDAFLVKIGFREELASGQLPQLLNLLFGNISLRDNIRLVDLLLPESFHKRFPGPRFGVAGIRRQLGVFGRPMVATALKPRGASVEKLASLAEEFALGGGDLIKDDHNLVEESLEAFQNRVEACQKGVARANRQTGFNTLYFPNISAPTEQLDDFVASAASAGIAGILISPLLVGLDMVRALSQRHGLIVMAHPTFTGTFFQDPAHGMEPGLLLGTLFRLAGADISVYPNNGGRFGFTGEQCAVIADRLKSALGELKAALPMPAGGMQLEQLAALAGQYGEDIGLLFGGSLLSDAQGLRQATARLMEGLRGHFPEVRQTPVVA